MGMEKKDALRMAVASLWANKLRSVLTLLGVVIGVASVIAVVTLVNGANEFVATKINRFGADVFTVNQMPTLVTNFEDYQRYKRRKVLGLDEYHAIQQQCHSCVGVGASTTTMGTVVVGRQSSTGTQVRGFTALMPELTNMNITEGRGLTQADEEHASHVAIIGTDVEENLLQDADPLGKEIRVDGVPYTVIGLGEKQGKTLGASQDDWVAVPLTAYQKNYGTQKSVAIAVRGGSGAAMETASDETRVILRSLRHDRPGVEDSFSLETSNGLVSLWSSISGGFEKVAVGIAAISLLVGGIVIMNIMLVSVTERTREIGVRKALGASKADVLLQFLLESAIMALLGGIIGVMLGVGSATIVTYALDFPSDVKLWSIFAGLGVAISVGVFFGVYPARKAADLDPIVALRSDF
ncbi:MAG: ABC transporter permease [Janthinobacterium lividum]